jgi:hypothetical protein
MKLLGVADFGSVVAVEREPLEHREKIVLELGIAAFRLPEGRTILLVLLF